MKFHIKCARAINIGADSFLLRNTGPPLAPGAASVFIIIDSFLKPIILPSIATGKGPMARAGVISVVGIIVKFASGFGTVYTIGLLSMMVFEVVFGGYLLFFSSKMT